MTTESPSPRLTFRFRSSELLATALQSLPQDPLCPWPPWHHGLAHPLRVSGLPFDVASLWDPRGAGRRRFSHPVSVRLCPSRPLVSTPVLLGLFEALLPSDGATSSDEGAQRRGNFRERPDTFAAVFYKRFVGHGDIYTFLSELFISPDTGYFYLLNLAAWSFRGELSPPVAPRMAGYGTRISSPESADEPRRPDAPNTPRPTCAAQTDPLPALLLRCSTHSPPNARPLSEPVHPPRSLPSRPPQCAVHMSPSPRLSPRPLFTHASWDGASCPFPPAPTDLTSKSVFWTLV